MHSPCLVFASLLCVWSCSARERADANAGGAGLESGGSAERAGGSGSGAHAGASTTGGDGLTTGGAAMGGAEDAAGADSGIAGASTAGLGGSGSGAGGSSGSGAGGSAAGSDGTAGSSGMAGGEANPYRACVGEDATDNSCPVPGSVCHANFGCEPPCPTGTISCPSPPEGGTAKPYCQQRLCRLDCGFGKTCPTGMVCDTGSAFCTSNGIR